MGPPLCLLGSSVRLLLVFIFSLLSVIRCNASQNLIEFWHGGPHASPGAGPGTKVSLVNGISVHCDGIEYDPQCLPQELKDQSLSCETDLSGIGSLDEVCTLSKSVDLSSGTIIAGTGSLEIRSAATLACSVPGCTISIVLLGNLIVNGSIHGGTLFIQAHNVTVAENSSLTARGLGGDPPPQTTGTPGGWDGAGGGHGGRGAMCARNDTDQADFWGGDGYAWATIENPWSYGSQGGNSSKKENYGGGGGGGRLNLAAAGILEVYGVVDADGDSGGEFAGGGSGGSAIIRATKLTGNGKISASGGSGWAGGSGGRISIDTRKNSGVGIFVQGGHSLGCPDNSGGAGTLFDVTRRSLTISNNGRLTQTETLLLDFPHFPHWEGLHVDGRAKVLMPLLWTSVQVRGQLSVISESSLAFGLAQYALCTEFELECDGIHASNATIQVYGTLILRTKMLLLEKSIWQIEGSRC